jgi:hypothetical protein
VWCAGAVTVLNPPRVGPAVANRILQNYVSLMVASIVVVLLFIGHGLISLVEAPYGHDA